jgi:putative oxidoreductase
MRRVGLLVSRTILGGYLAAHGAQKLFGSFGGPGLDAMGDGFEGMGLRPGKAMAAVAGATELGGGLLTATGVAYPLGPMAIAGTMVVASTTHRERGPLAAQGGFELPLTNFAAALALMSAKDPGIARLGPHSSRRRVWLSALFGAGMAAFAISQLLRVKDQSVAGRGAHADTSASRSGSGSDSAGHDGGATKEERVRVVSEERQDVRSRAAS